MTNKLSNEIRLFEFSVEVFLTDLLVFGPKK